MGHYHINMYLPKPLSTEEEKEALSRLKVENDQFAKNLLIEHNLRLVQYTASKFSNTQADNDDLFAIGTMGLIKGIDTFDIGKGSKLATYVSRCITNEILMYLRKIRKDEYSLFSIEEPLSTDLDGNKLTLNDILCDLKSEDAFDVSENTEYASLMLSVSLCSLPTKNLIVALYTLTTTLSQKEIGKRMSLSQSYVSKIQKAYRKETKKIRELPDELLKIAYTRSQSNDCNFIFFIDDFRKFCLSIHAKFLNPFIAFWETHSKEFEIADDTGRIIIRLPLDESSYLFCAELVQYISENTSRLSNINIWDFL